MCWILKKLCLHLRSLPSVIMNPCDSVVLTTYIIYSTRTTFQTWEPSRSAPPPPPPLSHWYSDVKTQISSVSSDQNDLSTLLYSICSVLHLPHHLFYAFVLCLYTCLFYQSVNFFKSGSLSFWPVMWIWMDWVNNEHSGLLIGVHNTFFKWMNEWTWGTTSVLSLWFTGRPPHSLYQSMRANLESPPSEIHYFMFSGFSSYL